MSPSLLFGFNECGLRSSIPAEVEKGPVGQPDDAAPASQPQPEAVQATASASEPNADLSQQSKSPEQPVVITGYPRGWDNIEVGSIKIFFIEDLHFHFP